MIDSELDAKFGYWLFAPTIASAPGRHWSKTMDQDRSASNHELIQRYLAACAELENHPYRLSGYSPRLQAIPGGHTHPYFVEEPEPLALGDFVPRLRIFMSKKEPIHVGAVQRLLNDILTDDAMRRDLANVVWRWKEHQTGGPLPILYDGRDVLPHDAWRLLIYGGRLHYDLEKLRTIEELTAHNMLWIYQIKFYDYIAHASNYVIGVGRVAKLAIERNAIDWSRARNRRSKAA